MNALRINPTQDRSRAKIEAILEASKTHFEEVGPEKFNTEVVADMAGCSVGTVYRYFSSREVILDLVAPYRDPDGSRTQEIVEILTDNELSDAHKVEALRTLLSI